MCFLALAMIFLTLFMFWVRQLIEKCYLEVMKSTNNTANASVLKKFLEDESFCEDKVRTSY